MMKLSQFIFLSLLLLSVTIVTGKAAAQVVQTDPDKGLTFRTGPDAKAQGIFTASCGKNDASELLCNPYQGDTLCDARLPLLCLLDIDAPVPEGSYEITHWTGGVTSLSPPRRADEFETLAEANAFCAKSFGPDWRVASFHDGGGWALQSFGIAADRKISFWVDIRDQPDSTCWAR
jgi:hypothetical protein